VHEESLFLSCESAGILTRLVHMNLLTLNRRFLQTGLIASTALAAKYPAKEIVLRRQQG